jgi:hypothetical protein
MKPLGFRHLGNCTKFSLTPEVETLEHESSRTGVRVIDREITLKQKMTLAITLDECNFQNWALWASGTSTADSANGASAALTNRAIAGGAAAYKGYYYELTDASGVRLMDITAADLSVRTDVGGTPATLPQGTGYTVDTKWGLIFLPSTSTHVDGHTLDFSYTSATAVEKAVDMVDMMTQSTISGFLRFKLINAANSDKEMIVDLHSVTLKAEGEMELIGDEFASIGLTGAAERNEIGYPTSPVGRIYYHADA